MQITLDPGHGAHDHGAVYSNLAIKYEHIQFNNVAEKYLNTIYAMIIGQKLLESGIAVAYTRTTNRYVDLKSRLEQFHASCSDLMLSIHCNAFTDVNVHGYEIFCDIKSLDYAKVIDKHLRQFPYVKRRGIKDGDFLYLLRASKRPVVLLELGFMSNPVELSNMLNPKYQLLLTERIKEALVEIGGRFANKLGAWRASPLQMPGLG